MNYKILEMNDYPEKLRCIKNVPNKLFYIGNINLLEKDMIAIVGTRRITKYGIKCAKYFAKELCLREIPIISGMAIGTDTVAHETSIELNNPTIAVLGTGFENLFPKENEKLFYEIIEKGGLVITEKEPDAKYCVDDFPKRNRIVSALSDGVLVIEAGYRSGTSITVNYAREQGKKIFAVPGTLDNKYGVGVNKFIKEGAVLVTDINDLIENYPQFLNKKRKSSSEKKLKPEYVEIYEILKEGCFNIEELKLRIENVSLNEVSSILTMMELEDIIEKDFGNGYKIKEENA